MSDDNRNGWFLIRIAVVGSPDEIIQAAVPDLSEELDARPHVRTRGAFWDADTRRIIVEVEGWGRTPTDAANGMAEEMFEIAAAVLGDFEAFHVEILAADRL